jgi:hypothetical protein
VVVGQLSEKTIEFNITTFAPKKYLILTTMNDIMFSLLIKKDFSNNNAKLIIFLHKWALSFFNKFICFDNVFMKFY